MTILGFQPGQNAVEVRQSGADVVTLRAATEKQAGLMTADHAQMLSELYQRVFEGGATITPLVPAAAPMPNMANYVTRAEVQQALASIPALTERAVAEPRTTIDITPRIQALEGALQKMRSIKPANPPSDMQTRIALLEARMNTVEESIVEVAQTVGDIEDMLRGLHSLVSIEDEEPEQIAG